MNLNDITVNGKPKDMPGWWDWMMDAFVNVIAYGLPFMLFSLLIAVIWALVDW